MIKLLAQGHAASQSQSWNQNPDLLTPSILFTTPTCLSSQACATDVLCGFVEVIVSLWASGSSVSEGDDPVCSGEAQEIE